MVTLMNSVLFMVSEKSFKKDLKIKYFSGWSGQLQKGRI